MIISIEELRSEYGEFDFSKFTDERLRKKLNAIEQMVRNHTRNGFINRDTITKCYVNGGYIMGDFKGLNVGDTVELYDAGINNGLYVIDYASEDEIALDKDIYDCGEMKLVKVEYPLDVIEGCIELLDYDCNYRAKSKRGVASETISRHSVSYVQSNNSNTLRGYPAHLLGFLEPYIRWRT